MSKTELLNGKDKRAALAAFRAGKRRITIDGRVFTLAKQDRKVRHLMGDEYITFNESWLIVKPLKGMLPTASLALGENLRSVK